MRAVRQTRIVNYEESEDDDDEGESYEEPVRAPIRLYEGVPPPAHQLVPAINDPSRPPIRMKLKRSGDSFTSTSLNLDDWSERGEVQTSIFIMSN